MKHWLILIFLNISTFGFSQIVENNSSWIIKGNGTAAIDLFTFPTIQFSVEKKISSILSFNVEAGYQFYSFDEADTTFLKPKGFKINTEARLYMSKFFSDDPQGKLDGFYFGFQPFYRQNQLTAGVDYYTDQDTINFKFDEFGVKKIAYGINCNFGYQQAISKRIVIDIYSGLGIMQKRVKNSDRQFNSEFDHRVIGGDLVPLFQSLNLSESSGRRINVQVGIRVGFKI
jgi:hypothetical protein